MGERLDIVTGLHRRTKRDYLGRMLDDKVACMEVARRFDREFWDGDRRYGYGGYVYDGRWEAVARRLVERYHLGPDARILDIGCGKGFLLYEFGKLLPAARLCGLDISPYAVADAKPEIRDRLFVHRAQDPLPFADKAFDLVISITTLHNLEIFDLKRALQEIERVGRSAYIVVESYRTLQELFNLQCWALTCEAFFSVRAWEWLFAEFGYQGDYEFIFFE